MQQNAVVAKPAASFERSTESAEMVMEALALLATASQRESIEV